MIFCNTPSVAESTEAVASSSTRMLLFFNKALPRQNNCLWPTLQFSPFSTTVRCMHVTDSKEKGIQSIMSIQQVDEPDLWNPTSLPYHALNDPVDIYPEPENFGI